MKELHMPKCYQLVGVPAAGKSTWYKNQTWMSECTYISTDRIIERYARSRGQTYTQVFSLLMPRAVDVMTQQVKRAKEHNRDIVWDQTSTTISSRRRKFNLLPNYEHIAVVFATPESSVLTQRLNTRPGKTIPTEVVAQMIRDLQLEPPTQAEGFTEIWYAA